jgi:alpha-amylase
VRPATGFFAAILIGTTAQAQVQWSPPLWTRGATCYEVFVRSFYDSNGDGIGDIPGLIAKLDYINDGNPNSRRSLGARCIWLMPVAESPSYHGYDVTNYYRVEPDYGTNDDFKRLMAAAHQRGIRVLVDMVLNHTSSDHHWFQSALRDPGSPYRAWYRWSPTKLVEKNWGGEVWHHSPIRDEYYYGLFWGGMPDLNYKHPPVMAEMKKVALFWLQDMGVDGFRLDAVPYLVEENGQVAHTGGTHGVLHDYGAYVRSVKPDAFTIGEVTYPNDILLTYYPEQLDSYFAFEVSDSIIAAVRAGSAKGLLAPLLRLQGDIPANRWSPFLRNHDQTRTRTELGGDMGLSRIASFLLLTMPGMPFVYYGEEIGMIGTKPDERLRTPMQWSRATGAGFTRGKPWERLQDDSLTTTVEAQDKDPSSLLSLHRRLIHLRDANSALGTGELVPLTASDNAVAAYIRRDGDRAVLVVANLSRAPLNGVSVTSRSEALRSGRWTTRNMLGGAATAPLRVGDDGQLRGYVPLTTLAPLEGYLIELSAPSDHRR